MELQHQIDLAPEGGTVRIPRGVFQEPLVIEKSLTLVGEGPGRSVLDAEGKSACVLINGRTAKVTLKGLTLRNGASPEGGCIAFRGQALDVEDCVLEGGKAKLYGGGGARLAGQSARFVRTRITGCAGQQGGGILADEECAAELLACVLAGNSAVQGGGLRIKEGARVRLLHCTVAGNQAVGQSPAGPEVLMSGTQTRTPALEVVNSIIAPLTEGAPPVASLGAFAGRLTLAHSLFPPAAQAHLPPGPGLVFAAPEFMPRGQHRFALSSTSPAVGRADPEATPPALTDPLGNPLQRGGESDIGAYAI